MRWLWVERAGEVPRHDMGDEEFVRFSCYCCCYPNLIIAMYSYSTVLYSLGFPTFIYSILAGLLGGRTRTNAIECR